ncbi:hypothetical protein N7466_009390 [Penicillium verhagenii]|uniref:uncharacterized protein n=1 Tax=Penicillium verhagenii TaxID=1562060 RepID=UPI0025455597|nr:uncharacterized protein N7466_009390 [Penicillium verhagenii]KAJ5921064.1 hypothetical protein N7466_009390 [Penicillium verhagenii]
MASWTQVFNSLDMLIYSRIDYKKHLEYKKPKTPHTIRDKIGFCLSIPFNARRLGTKWQINHVYRFQDCGEGAVPSRNDFLWETSRSILCTCCVALLWFFVSFYLELVPKQTKLFELLDQSHLLDNPPWESLPAHIHLVLFFIVALFILLKCIYAFLSIATVSLYLSSPQQWPPFQASAREAWSVRRFWGRFWHQTLRSLLSSNADFVISVLHVTPDDIIVRYVRFFLCFIISGLIHLSLDHAIGISLADSGALAFFLVQPIAFMAEDMAEWLSKRYGVMTRDNIGRRTVGRSAEYKLGIVGVESTL